MKQYLGRTTNKGGWHKLPNDNLYPCPINNNYNVKCKNLIYRIHEKYEHFDKICITIEKTNYQCNDWLFDIFKSVKETRLGLVLTIDCLELKYSRTPGLNWTYIYDNVTHSECLKTTLDLITRILQDTKELIQDNVMIDIKISYSTFFFEECHKVFLQLFGNIMLDNNGNNNNYNNCHAMVDHKKNGKNNMACFRVCLR